MFFYVWCFVLNFKENRSRKGNKKYIVTRAYTTVFYILAASSSAAHSRAALASATMSLSKAMDAAAASTRSFIVSNCASDSLQHPHLPLETTSHASETRAAMSTQSSLSESSLSESESSARKAGPIGSLALIAASSKRGPEIVQLSLEKYGQEMYLPNL